MRLTAFLAAKNSHLFHLVLFCDKISLNITQPLHICCNFFVFNSRTISRQTKINLPKSQNLLYTYFSDFCLICPVDLRQFLLLILFEQEWKLECSKYAENISKLCDEFANRFNDLRKSEMEFKLFSQPFDVTPDDVPDCYQMEAIELQSIEHMTVMMW